MWRVCPIVDVNQLPVFQSLSAVDAKLIVRNLDEFKSLVTEFSFLELQCMIVFLVL